VSANSPNVQVRRRLLRNIAPSPNWFFS
jgi:hypothetical protein